MIVCSNCGAENPVAKKFCGDCGTALAGVCASCGGSNAPGKRFCGDCGASLEFSTVSVVTASAPAAAVAALAERRLVSVLFADLVGFTAASESRDAEDTRELLTRYFDIARLTIERYGGTLEKFIGDAVMAVWGAPVAREDDAERAVRAALELVAGVPALDPDLRVRAGVLTGEAAVTLGAQDQGMVAGDLVNTASRIQGAAEPGTVLVGESTKPAPEPAVAYDDAGEHQLKGKADLVELWRAVRVVAGTRGALRASGLEAPFVGRNREFRLVKELFHDAADEQRAQLALVTGIAGIGKSRLAWEFEKYIDGLAAEVFWHLGRCLSYGEGVAYWALAEMVRMRCRILEDEEPDSARSSCGSRSRNTSLTPRSAPGSSPVWRTFSASRKARPETRRTSSRPGGSCSSAWRTSRRRFSCSQIFSGRTPVCSASLSMCWAGRGAIRCSCWHWPDRSSPTSGRAGARVSGASVRSISNRSPPWRWAISSPGSFPAFRTTCRIGFSTAPRAFRSTRSRPSACCSTVAC